MFTPLMYEVKVFYSGTYTDDHKVKEIYQKKILCNRKSRRHCYRLQKTEFIE